MAITAQDIHNQSFAIGRKGYDVDEVDIFLEHVADEIDILNGQIAQLQIDLAAAQEGSGEVSVVETQAVAPVAEANAAPETAQADQSELANSLAEKDDLIAQLQAQLAEKQADDSVISQALIVAQRSADEIIVKANAQAAETMQDARDEADRIVSRANSDKKDILDAIHKLEGEREDTRVGYADLLHDFIEDASRKLNELGYDDDIESIPGIGRSAEKLDIVYDESVANYMPAEAVEAMQQAEEPVAAPVEKDLSGFGDVDDSYEDID